LFAVLAGAVKCTDERCHVALAILDGTFREGPPECRAAALGLAIAVAVAVVRKGPDQTVFVADPVVPSLWGDFAVDCAGFVANAVAGLRELALEWLTPLVPPLLATPAPPLARAATECTRPRKGNSQCPRVQRH
jgi:hypothetical protein